MWTTDRRTLERWAAIWGIRLRWFETTEMLRARIMRKMRRLEMIE